MVGMESREEVEQEVSKERQRRELGERKEAACGGGRVALPGSTTTRLSRSLKCPAVFPQTSVLHQGVLQMKS